MMDELKVLNLKVDEYKLKKLCLDFNPYEDITEEQVETLKEFEIEDTFDPFVVTNKLLKLLEENEKKLKALETRPIM